MSEVEPKRFGPYVLLDHIGDGGMAEIFLAKRHGYSGFEKRIALKRILPRYSGNKTFVRMLIQEAKLAANLQHFNIVQVLDLGDVDGQVYLAMEYVHGRDLATVLGSAYRRRETIPVPVALCIATEFLTGLDFAHRMTDDDGRALGIIHRDISPQNILISSEGEVKVTDFGIARFISEKADFHLPGNLHGKFGYMSPEQVGGYEIDQRSDIFSAGVVLWEMLTGRRLFRGKTPEKTVDLVVEKVVPPPSDLNPDVPLEVDAICLKALERDRSSRFQTIGALLGELSAVADSLPRRAAPRDVSVYMRREFGHSLAIPHRRRKRVRSTISSEGRQLLGEYLRDMEVLSTHDLNVALAEQRARGGRIGEVLVDLALVTQDDVARALAKQYGYPFIATNEALEAQMPLGLSGRYPRDAAERTGLLPLHHDERGTVHVLGYDPTSESPLLEARVILGARQLKVFLTSRIAVSSLIRRWYSDEEPTDFGTPTILVADGDLASLAPFLERLADEELQVVQAEDGRRARELSRARNLAAAVIDASLPKIDGFNLLLELHQTRPEVPVFITSARADGFRQAKALELGAEDFLTKPLVLDPVVSKLRRAVARTPRQEGETWGPDQGVGGDLLHMSLVDIVQSLEVAKKSAAIDLQYEDGRSGKVWVSEGRLHRCEPSRVGPQETFFALARPGPGRFRIQYRDASDQQANLTQPTTFLLMEAMRVLDESTTDSSDGLRPIDVDDLVLTSEFEKTPTTQA